MKNLTKAERSYISTTQKKISKTIYHQKLIEEGDRIVTGLSGGKDSFVLLDSIISRKRALKFNFELAAVHINVKNVPYQADLDFMQSYCNKNKIDFHIIDIEVDFEKDKKISPCFICSWHRRTELFKFTTKNRFNKLAFGHHLDDAVETLLLNMSFNGEISSMPYKVDMLNNKFQIIRPLLDTEEKYIAGYADLMDFNREIKKCPFAKKSNREKIRKYIDEIEKINPDVKINLFRSMNKIVTKFLPENKNQPD